MSEAIQILQTLRMQIQRETPWGSWPSEAETILWDAEMYLRTLPSARDLDLIAAEEKLRRDTEAQMDVRAFRRFWMGMLGGLLAFWAGVGWLVWRAVR